MYVQKTCYKQNNKKCKESLIKKKLKRKIVAKCYLYLQQNPTNVDYMLHITTLKKNQKSYFFQF